MNVSGDIATALDPTRLFRARDFTPDEWQRQVLQDAWDRLLMLCSRQSGKSTVISALAMHQGVYTPESLVLITAPSERQAKETFRKFWKFYRAAGRPAGVEKKSELRCEFENGSRVIALPGKEKTIRSYSAVDLLILDEAARVPDDLYHAVRPMLAVSQGRLAALTTPWGKRGWFYHAWKGKGDGTDFDDDWKRVKTTARDCPRLTEAFLQAEREELGLWIYKQEYLCQFVDAVDSLFRSSDIEAAFSADVAPLSLDTDDEPTDDTVSPLSFNLDER